MKFRSALVLLCLFGWATAALSDERPNIIVFYTDDHGHADLSCQGVVDDVRTPNVDALAKSGVRAIHGYSTAPQCIPSRAGLLVGKFQSRFGVEANGQTLEGFDNETTFAKRLQDAGYATAQFGKWHLGPGPQITQHGFTHVFNQNSQAQFHANIDLDGKDRLMGIMEPEMYHVDGCSRAAVSVINRYRDQPFLLYVAYRAPHVPLDAPPKYLERFPGKMAERRRQALAMLSAVDDGVGSVLEALKENGLTEKTLIFYIGDNGAPLKITKADKPGGGPGWDGSLNTPLNGEKGMLAEGGIHTPYVVAWPGTIPGGQEYPHPISALDVAATATAIAGIKTKPKDLDGVNLIPFLSGENTAAPHESLMWRWVAQAAIREGNWKLLRGGDREYLYDLGSDIEEKFNLASQYPERADALRKKLQAWTNELSPPGLSTGPMASTWNNYFDFYLDGKPQEPGDEKVKKGTDGANRGGADRAKGWAVRNGEMNLQDGSIGITTDSKSKGQKPFLVHSGINVEGPATATILVKAADGGNISLAWRTAKQKDFSRECMIEIDLAASDDWQTHVISIPNEEPLIHLRVHLPTDNVLIGELNLESSKGQSVHLW